MQNRSLAFLPLVLVALAACTSGVSPSSPEPTAPGSPAVGEIDHPTGPTDVVLRLEEGGGFVPIEFLTTQAPTFTLYGDRMVIFRDRDVAFPGPRPDGTSVYPPFSTGRLDEQAVQELLDFAIVEGGLGLARNGRYDNPNVADAGTAIFDIDAGGHRKRVEVYALGLDVPGGQDAAARAAFQALADRLRHFGRGVAEQPPDYVPERYRGVLFESEGPVGAARPWPWSDIALDDFAADPDGLGLPRRVMSPDEIALLGVAEPYGGLSGINLTSPDGARTYMFSARPLFPDESS
jgi:hypothetical protein